MKKAIFMLAVGAMALTACSDTEVIEEGVQSPAIGFNTNVGKNSRAIDNDNFAQFFVYGSYTAATSTDRITVFNGTGVTKTGDKWGYTDTRYWVPQAKYTFAAYAMEGTEYAGFRANYTTAGLLNLDGVLVDNTHQNDLVYATAGSDAAPIVGQTTNNATVAFKFTHILSRLNFHFISAFPAGYNVKVSNVRLNNIRNKGHFNGIAGAVGTWAAPVREPEGSVPVINASFKDDDNVIASANGEVAAKEITSEWVYVLPFQYTSANVDIIFDINVETEAGQAILGARNIKGTWTPNWELNKSYTYNITVTGDAAGLEAIQFSGTVNEWVEGTPATPDFNLSGGEVPTPAD